MSELSPGIEDQNMVARCNAERVRRVRPGMPFWSIDFGEVWNYRYMLLYLIRRDIVVLYKQTVLGPAWVVLQPFLMSFLFSLIFGRIAGIETDGIPGFLFYFGNNVFWGFLALTYTTTSTVFTNGKQLMSKVYFPRLILPFSGLGGSLFKLAIQLVFLIGLIVFYLFQGAEFEVGVKILLLAAVVVQMSMIALGVGFLFACATLKYRDLSVIGNIFVQGWMYLSPVAYPISQVPGVLAEVMKWNPVTSALELARYAMFGSACPSAQMLVFGWVTTILIFFVGLFSFNVAQRKFVDVV